MGNEAAHAPSHDRREERLAVRAGRFVTGLAGRRAGTTGQIGHWPTSDGVASPPERMMASSVSAMRERMV